MSAVDSNFYDWYRTHNDEVSGTGSSTACRVGSVSSGRCVRLRFAALDVVAPQGEPLSGTFRFVGTPAEQASAPYTSLELYVESRAARADQGDALSGRYARQMRLGDIGCPCAGCSAGANGRIELAFLRDWFAADTAEVMTGEIRGDTIVGSYRGYAGIARFVRQPPAAASR